MKMTLKTLLAGLGIGLLALPVMAVNRTVKPEEYAVISERNPFGLVPPPPPAPVKEPEKPKTEPEPPPNVELTGIYHNRIKERTYALFLIQEKGKTEKQSYMWSINEGDDGFKVLAIDQKEAKVRLSVRGQESTITFAEPKQTGGLPGATGMPAVPNTGVTAMRPGVTGGIQQYGSETRTGGQLTGGRSMRSAVGGAIPVQTGGAASTLRPIPGRTLRTGQGAVVDTVQQVPQLTIQEQEALIEIQRAANKVTGANQAMPPLPPTSMTTPQDLRAIIVDPVSQNQPPAIPRR